MTEEMITQKKEELLNLLRNTPDRVLGNVTLKRKLGLEKEDAEFFSIRDSLIDESKVTTGRGKGGATRLIEANENEQPDFVGYDNDVHGEMLENHNGGDFDNVPNAREVDLYEPLLKTLQDNWLRDNDYDPQSVVKVTAHGGARRDGEWSRPDIVIVTKRKYLFLGSGLEVITFEVKKKGDWRYKSCVFEALSHSTSAHRSYLMIHVDRDERSVIELHDTAYLCRLFGIGLVLFTDPTLWETFEVMNDAMIKESDPSRIEGFLKTQLDEKSKMAILQYLTH